MTVVGRTSFSRTVKLQSETLTFDYHAEHLVMGVELNGKPATQLWRFRDFLPEDGMYLSNEDGKPVEVEITFKVTGYDHYDPDEEDDETA